MVTSGVRFPLVLEVGAAGQCCQGEEEEDKMCLEHSGAGGHSLAREAWLRALWIFSRHPSTTTVPWQSTGFI